MTYISDPINLGLLSSGSHKLVVELVDDSSNPLNPTGSKQDNFTLAKLKQVADVTAIGADVAANGAGRYYQITDESLVTHTDNHQNRN